MNLFTALILCAIGASSSTESQVSVGKAQRLVVSSGEGDIHVRAVRDNKVKVVAHPYPGNEQCTATAKIENKDVVVRIEGGPMGGTCHADVDVFMPASLELNLKAVHGTLYASGVHANVTLHIEQGNVVLGGKIPVLDATLDNGSMSANGLMGDATVTLNGGNAQLWFEAPRAHVQLDVKRGNITVTAPVSAANIQANLMRGQINASVDSAAAGAAFSVDGTIEQGNLTVRSSKK